MRSRLARRYLPAGMGDEASVYCIFPRQFISTPVVFAECVNFWTACWRYQGAFAVTPTWRHLPRLAASTPGVKGRWPLFPLDAGAAAGRRAAGAGGATTTLGWGQIDPYHRRHGWHVRVATNEPLRMDVVGVIQHPLARGKLCG